MQLVRPSVDYLPGYTAALERGWSSDSERGAAAAAEELARIRAEPATFLRWLDDPEGVGPAITLPDGSTVPRLPGFRRWMWDGEFAGSIGLRWQPGSTELPPYCLGHIGYAVVPWKQRRGYASAALRAMLAEAQKVGLPFVHITTDIDNTASQRVIERAGGVLQEQFAKPLQFHGRTALRYRVDLPAGPILDFRPLAEEDLPLLHAWVQQPHVAQWWEEPSTWEAIRDEYLPVVHGTDSTRAFVVHDGAQAVGFIQSYVVVDSGDGWWPAEADAGARGIDQFLADPLALNRGLGTAMVRALIGQLFQDPEVTVIQTDPSPHNGRAIRCYEKAGFQRVGIVQTPDGPALLMRCPRPPG